MKEAAPSAAATAVAAPAAAAPVQATAPKAATIAAPRQGSLLSNSISIKMPPPPAPVRQKVQVESKPLTQEDLERYWQEAADELDLKELLGAAKVHLGESQRIVDVEATETWFAQDFRPHRTDVMELLRKKSGMPLLECNVIPLFVSKETIIYSAEDKYKAMLELNPQLVALRKLFPEIDL